MAKDILTGRNIYLDKRNRTVYYDIFTKTGYVIPPEDERKIFVYKNRLAIILFASILSIDTIFNIMVAAIFGVVLFLIVEAYYRFVVFKKLKVSSSFDREKRKSPLKTIVEANEKGKSIILVCLYIAFSILVIINAYSQNYTIWLMILSYAFSLFGIYSAITHLIAITKMKK